MRRVVVGLVLLAGCDRIFGLEGRGPDARPVAPGCSDQPFVGPTVIPGIDNSERRFQPQLRHDLLEVWYGSAVSGDNEVFVARRTSTTVPFGPSVEAFPAVSGFDTNPALTGDGLRLVFATNRTGTEEVFEATRASLSDDFGTPSILVGTDDFINSIDLSYDGLTLYFTTFDNDERLFSMTRAAFGAPFENRMQLADGIAYFSVSSDGLELFYNPMMGTNLFRRVRASIDVPFDPMEQRVLDDGEDPDLTHDGETLVFGVTAGLAVMTRTCP